MYDTCLETLRLQTKILPSMYEPAHSKRVYLTAYLKELKTFDILLPYYTVAHQRVAGPGAPMLLQPEELWWGWEGPLSDIRGHFSGSFLSACAQLVTEQMDQELLGKANFVVDEIRRCQKTNGGRWGFPIPEEYLLTVRDRKYNLPATPIYVCHKTMMGLIDMYLFTGNTVALEAVKGCADWFYDYSQDLTPEHLEDMMIREEPGGIMEAFADLYGITHDEKYLELMRRFERPALYNPLYEGRDVLTNMHANAVVPQVHGCAKAYEVTGEERYRTIVENFWKLAVESRGMYATGGTTCGEIWPPMSKQAARLGQTNQEHCVVYQMVRMADYLLRWTGEAKYADYIERNIYNGLFSQGISRRTLRTATIGSEDKTEHTRDGIVTYFQPLAAGSKKTWGTHTKDFSCCNATMVQANAKYHDYVFYRDREGIVVAQYLDASSSFEADGRKAGIRLVHTNLTGATVFSFTAGIETRPDYSSYDITLTGGGRYMVKLRLPWWLTGPAHVLINGQETAYETRGDFALLSRDWQEGDMIRAILPKGLTVHPLADEPGTVAFLDGPVLLAGMVAEERTLYGDISNIETFLAPHCEREWNTWTRQYRTVNQPTNFIFRPLYSVFDETYTVYFPVKKP